jgi:Protein of unknown function (DUF3891)
VGVGACWLVIVRDAGDAWQVVLQTDHADLSAAFAAQWADPGPRHESVTLAAERHDDGWAVWEQAPIVADGKPVNFLDVGIPAHLAFYRACIAAVTEQDAYAGLLVSMHGAGIYRQRYGRDPAMGLARAVEVKDLVDDFVAEQEAGFETRVRETGVDDERRWADYELLQLYDRLSLYFCMRDLAAGEEAEIQGSRIVPVAPWRVRIDPYPFSESPASFSVLRRLVPKGARRAGELLALPAERAAITIER